jgi:hypothetical protein
LPDEKGRGPAASPASLTKAIARALPEMAFFGEKLRPPEWGVNTHSGGLNRHPRKRGFFFGRVSVARGDLNFWGKNEDYQ